MGFHLCVPMVHLCQVDEDGAGFDAGAAGDIGGGTDADDDDNDGGVDFGLLMAADDASQSQFVTSQTMDEMGDATLLTGDNLLAVPRKVRL